MEAVLKGKYNYVVKNNGEQVPLSSLNGVDVVGLYFSAHWCPPCRGFTPVLTNVYKELKAQGKSFEVVFLSSDSDEKAFKEYFAEMPWLSVPYDDRETDERLSTNYQVDGIPMLVLLNGQGKVLSENARGIVQQKGAGGYPFH